MYDNEFETTENSIWTKDKIEPQHICYPLVPWLFFRSTSHMDILTVCYPQLWWIVCPCFLFFIIIFFLFSSIEDWRNHQNASNRRAWDTRQSWWEVYPSNCSLYICYGANKDNSLNKLLHVAINYLILMTSVFDLGVLLVTTWGWLNLEKYQSNQLLGHIEAFSSRDSTAVKRVMNLGWCCLEINSQSYFNPPENTWQLNSDQIILNCFSLFNLNV